MIRSAPIGRQGEILRRKDFTALLQRGFETTHLPVHNKHIGGPVKTQLAEM